MTSTNSQLSQEAEKRRTFAIISHPDAGKTTLTEKLLLFGGAIQLAGTVKSRKSSRHATSDWMELEKQRGISVTTSVMQFDYKGRVVNLLDTPGHEDFSEDTYRTLTAVDSALMVIDCVKGVEPRTISLMEVCRLRTTPIVTFINKCDREGRDPLSLLDEVEQVLNIRCAPVTWPIGGGRHFKGIYHLLEDAVYIYPHQAHSQVAETMVIQGIDNPLLKEMLGDTLVEFQEQMELVHGASHVFNEKAYLKGELTPVFFGSAVNNFGVKELLDGFVAYAPSPQPRLAIQGNQTECIIEPQEEKFTGFVFKIQANMDPAHRDRIAFLRVCSGCYEKGMKMYHVRAGREILINNALTFMAGDRAHVEQAWPGDIIGLHNHGTIQIGDTFSSKGEVLQFTGIPHFAPELFRLVRLKDPLKMKALLKGLTQLAEEGAVQIFRPLNSQDLILGAVGLLQFDVVKFRLQNEYNVTSDYQTVNTVAARWITSKNTKKLTEFTERAHEYLALDGAQQLTYLAPSKVNLNLAIERWPDIVFQATREHH